MAWFVNLDAAALQKHHKKAETNQKQHAHKQWKGAEAKAVQFGKEDQTSKPKSKSKSKSVTDDKNDNDSLNTGKVIKKQKQDLTDHKVTVYICAIDSTTHLPCHNLEE